MSSEGVNESIAYKSTSTLHIRENKHMQKMPDDTNLHKSSANTTYK